ncbi:MAG TPA: tRNA lysidine(34) synthetase TilS [Actinomycetota bacterium]|nr:tRNA lysidine(34) synthetase TilS [Actinomycetota bacterium]
MPQNPPAVARVVERVTATVRRHGMFDPGETVVVACSGGPDSVCLLHTLHRLRRLFRIRLAVFHFDHRLRDGSADDAAYVERQAERLKVPLLRREAIDAPTPGQSIEAWARLARYAALTEEARGIDAPRAAVGHTLDDQAETVLLGITRGGGIDAVAGMPPVGTAPPRGFPIVRPLLETTRDEVRAFCRALRLRPREDPSNLDRRFLRNRLRHEVLPALEASLDRNVKVTLARIAENVRSDAEYLDAVASREAKHVTTVGEREVLLDAARLAALPEPVGVRVVQQALRVAAAAAGGSDVDAGAAHLTGVLDLAAGRPGRRVDLPGGLLALRTREYVRVSSASDGRGRR